ncbi:MAG: PHP domain-containing protein [Treponema sp.]|jgi:predicted metal-dependent phosphoesterase TrpH|nr:PHP domain-containing protein [Treponema sp.]
MVDFHTHSNISDGDLSPAALVREAIRQGLSAIALTDHDTINGLESAKNAALSETTVGKNFRFIPGIEININWTGGKSAHGAPAIGPGGEFHLLGLGINSPSPGFIAAIETLSRRREARNREILERMHELSIDVSWEDLLSVSRGELRVDDMHNEGTRIEDATPHNGQVKVTGSHSIGRPHFAMLLIKRKIVRNIDQAFDRYLGVGKPLYVPKEGMNFEEAVALIRESGGIPVLAHPISLYVAWGRLPGLVKILKDMGLMGLEAWHPTAKQGSCRRLEDLGKSLGLYITEGSDFHGSASPNRRLGYSSKGRKISDAILEAIPELALAQP